MSEKPRTKRVAQGTPKAKLKVASSKKAQPAKAVAIVANPRTRRAAQSAPVGQPKSTGSKKMHPANAVAMNVKPRAKRLVQSAPKTKPKVLSPPKVQPAKQRATRIKPEVITPALVIDEIDTDSHVVPYDKNLLERARTQWQFGDWESLAALDRNTLQHHPDRAKLALLAAAGNLQVNNVGTAKQFIRLAQDWGCSKKLVSQILIAGVHNSLGRAAAVAGQQTRALKHFESAISVGTPGSNVKLRSQARMGEQLQQVRLLRGNATLDVVAVDKRPLQGSAYNAASVLDATHKSRDVLHDYWRSNQQDPIGYVNASEKRSLRLVETFRQYVGPGRILEIGTNAGRNLHHLYAAGYFDLVGIEISPVAVSTLRNIYPELSEVPIYLGAVEELIESFSDKSFECVFTMAVLEHIHNDSDWIFAHIARIANCVITIEDELRSGERHFSRNYERVFTSLGMRQSHMEDRTKWGLPTGFVARVFV
jgi:hypothetical protein